MARSKIYFVGFFVLGIILWETLSPNTSFAQENDQGFIRALQTDSAPIENTYYFQTSFDNNFASRHGLYFYGEGLFALGKDWGLEVDFPNLFTRQPLGQVPLVMGPIGVLFRYEAWHFGGWNEETAGVFSIAAGGAYGFSNSTFPWVGSSWSIEALGGYRLGRFFLQEDGGYQGGIDPQVQSQWQANTALGYRLTTEWYLQMEADFSADAGLSGNSSWTFIPQIAFQPGDWLFEWGESFGDSLSVYTQLMVARAL